MGQVTRSSVVCIFLLLVGAVETSGFDQISGWKKIWQGENNGYGLGPYRDSNGDLWSISGGGILYHVREGQIDKSDGLIPLASIEKTDVVIPSGDKVSQFVMVTPTKGWAVISYQGHTGPTEILEYDGVFWSQVQGVEGSSFGFPLISVLAANEVWFGNGYRYIDGRYERFSKSGFRVIKMRDGQNGLAVRLDVGGNADYILTVFAGGEWKDTRYKVANDIFEDSNTGEVWFSVPGQNGRNTLRRIKKASLLEEPLDSLGIIAYGIHLDPWGDLWYRGDYSAGGFTVLNHTTMEATPVTGSNYDWRNGASILAVTSRYVLLAEGNTVLKGAFIFPSLRAIDDVHFDAVAATELPGVNTQTRREFFIKNNGDGTLKIASIKGSGGMFRFQAEQFTRRDRKEFDVVQNKGWIPAGDSLRVAVVYFPTEAGSHTGRIVIESNDRTNPTPTINLFGATAGTTPVTTAPPGAGFTASAASGTAPLTVLFTNQSTGSPVSLSWIFGDGGTSTDTNPSHTYTVAGTYTITLTATNAGGPNSITKTVTVAAPTVAPPVVAFAPSATSGAAPLSVSFTNQSTGATSYSWSFGDGSTSVEGNPSHTFGTPGTYSVILTATNAWGSSSNTQTVSVTQPALAPPVAAFTPSSTSGTAPLTVSFTNQSTGSPTSHSWSFGDGATSVEANPSRTYTAAGTYPVTLTATNAGGSHSTTKTIAVTAVPFPVEKAVVEFDRDTLAFVDVVINSAAQDSVELLNDGGDTLRVERIVITPTLFRPARNLGKFSVAPGESKFIPVTFRPRTAGTFTGTLEVRSDAAGSPHRLPLLGKTPELSPKIVLIPEDSLRFASVGTGQNDIKSLRIRNDGQGVLAVSLSSDRADFKPDRDTVLVAPAQSRQVQITFQPTQAGTRTGRLTLHTNDRQFETLFVGMRGFSGALRFEPVSVDFGDLSVGAQKDSMVLLINETADAATLTLDLTGAGFTIDPKSAVVDAGQRRPVRVRFSPASLGLFSAKIEIRDRGVSLQAFGSGVDVKVRPPTGLRAALDGSRVNLSWNANTEPGLSHYVVYRNQQDNFEPARADSIGRANKSSPRLTDTPPVGTSYYRVVAVDNQGNRSEPSETASAVLASPPTVSDAVLDFGQVRVGGSKFINTLIFNPGPGIMNISNMVVTGRDGAQFVAAGQGSNALPAGQSKTVSITFSPRSSGLKSGVLNIAHDKGSPLTVALSGKGEANPLRVDPTALSFANTEVGTPVTKTLRLVNSGNSILSVKLETSGVDRNLFRLSRTPIQIRALNEAQVRVIFDPKTPGTKRATLIISPVSGNAFSRIEVSLSGSAVAARGLSEAMVDLAKVVGAQAQQPSLGKNYPNPFNAQTLIPYQLAAPGWVKLAVYDMLGQRVRTLVEGTQEAGNCQVTWDSRSELGNAVASGIYFIRLEAGAFRAVQKIVLLR